MHAATRLDAAVREALRHRRRPILRAVALAIRPASSRFLLLPLAALLWRWADVRGDRRLARTIREASGAIVVSALYIEAVKRLTDRQRPDAHVKGGFPGPGRAFPSGHSGNVFALAAVVRSRYRRAWLTALCYGFALLAAYGRTSEERHWATDVLVGAALGSAVGHAISRPRI